MQCLFDRMSYDSIFHNNYLFIQMWGLGFIIITYACRRREVMSMLEAQTHNSTNTRIIMRERKKQRKENLHRNTKKIISITMMNPRRNTRTWILVLKEMSIYSPRWKLRLCSISTRKGNFRTSPLSTKMYPFLVSPCSTLPASKAGLPMTPIWRDSANKCAMTPTTKFVN